jgi:hypothetical protein
MGELRPLAASDLPGVANLFQRIFKNVPPPAPDALVCYLKALFLEAPDQDSEILSQVYLKPDGSVGGFIGALPLPMSLHGTPVRAAVAVCLMVDNHLGNPLVGARLLRAFLAGSQDISLGETASETTVGMWLNLRGIVLPAYSLEWVRIIKPGQFVVELLGNRIPAARALTPLAWPLDAWLRRRMQGRASRWVNVPPSLDLPNNRTCPDLDVDNETLCELVPQFTSTFSLHPRWTQSRLRYILADAEKKTEYGGIVRRVVTMPNGTPIGAFIYHGRPGRIGHVLQVLAANGQAESVIDRLVNHATASGIVALKGRTQPALLPSMMTRRFGFIHSTSSIAYARDPALLKPFLTGDAFFNGLAGEAWTRLIGYNWTRERQIR